MPRCSPGAMTMLEKAARAARAPHPPLDWAALGRRPIRLLRATDDRVDRVQTAVHCALRRKHDREGRGTRRPVLGLERDVLGVSAPKGCVASRSARLQSRTTMTAESSQRWSRGRCFFCHFVSPAPPPWTASRALAFRSDRTRFFGTLFNLPTSVRPCAVVASFSTSPARHRTKSVKSRSTAMRTTEPSSTVTRQSTPYRPVASS